MRCFLPAHAFAAVVGIALAAFPIIAPAADVPKWSTVEIVLKASGHYANPYAAGPTLTAMFSGPGGATKTVNGFWDGGNTFKIRFTPTAVGPWSYRVSSSDAGMNGKTGSINCVAAEGRQARLPPRRCQVSVQLRVGRRHALFHVGANLLRRHHQRDGQRQLEDVRQEDGGLRHEQDPHARLRPGLSTSRRWSSAAIPTCSRTSARAPSPTATGSICPTGKNSTRWSSTWTRRGWSPT